MHAPTAPIAYPVAQASKEIGVSRSRMYELLARGEIPARKLGGRTIILRDDLVRYVQSLPAYEPGGNAA